MTCVAEPILTWEEIAAKIAAPPRKLVVCMVPPEEGPIVRASGVMSQIDDAEEAQAFAQYSMPYIRKFLETPQARDMHPVQRKYEMLRGLRRLAKEFKGLFYKAQRKEECAVKIGPECLGRVVAAPKDFAGVPPPKVGMMVATHPEDGTLLTAFGQLLTVYGAFLPEMGWEPRYCDWWESVPVEVDMEELKLRAFGNKIVIRLDPKKTEVMGLHLPDVAQRWDADATIESVGPAQTEVHEGERWSVDMSLVTQGGMQFVLGEAFERQFVIPPEALLFRYV